ncbi:MAG: PDDEXK nuclease domain-containing protein [Weeksellaceae bacterium]
MTQLHSKNNQLVSDLIQLIENNKQKVAVQVNSTMTLTYWQIGYKINHEILGNERAEYGEQLIKQVSSELVIKFGNSFTIKNLRRMIQFSTEFQSFENVVSLSRQLSWSHFIVLIPLNLEKKKYYANKIIQEKWSVRETRKQIERKHLERNYIASEQTKDFTNIPHNLGDKFLPFKDPYFLDFLGLKEGYLENDLESAILVELENFILELGKGFAFVERQKRIIIDNQDFYIDLLFYHRKLKRLVAIELKIGKFKAAHKGQMELYLQWLNNHEREEGEEPPIGLILCSEKSEEQIALLSPWKDGIMIAEYWTELPPKSLLEEKLNEAILSAKERIEKRKLLE